MTAVHQLILDVVRLGANFVATAPDKVKVVGRPLPTQWIEQLRAHKVELYALLQQQEHHDTLRSIQNAIDCFEERAAILEYDGGFPRDESERQAREQCMQLKKQRDLEPK